MPYVDGFVVPVPLDRLEDYRRLARRAGRIWREHGALEYVECVADDVKPGKVTSFPQAVRLREGEVVIFSWIVYKTRAHRDRVNAKVMKDARLKAMMDPKAVPFDARRMFFGGFKMMLRFDEAKSPPPAKARPRRLPAPRPRARAALTVEPS